MELNLKNIFHCGKYMKNLNIHVYSHHGYQDFTVMELNFKNTKPQLIVNLWARLLIQIVNLI